MPLSPLDDYPVHQISEPIRRVATSDRNFYDRYYFNLFSLDDDLSLIVGLGSYPNLGTFDGFALAVHEGRHMVVRASRELGADRMDTSVGPLQIEVLRGLKTVRITLEPNEWDMAFDLTFDGSVPAHEENRHFMRQNERVTYDTCRFAQTGRWCGTIEAGGASFTAEPQRWWGCRDRSWGVRSIGEPEPPGIRVAQPASMFWNYAQIQFEDHAIVYMCHELADGSRILEEAVRIWSDPARGVDELGRPEHDLEFVPGTRTVDRGRLNVRTPEGPAAIELEVVRPVYVGLGTGYGTDPDWRHGMYQGPLKVEGLSFDTRAVQAAIGHASLVDAVCLFEYEGRVGYGLWEYVVVGPHERYGFKSWTDGFGDADR